jgi:hypothetical protein
MPIAHKILTVRLQGDWGADAFEDIGTSPTAALEARVPEVPLDESLSSDIVNLVGICTVVAGFA